MSSPSKEHDDGAVLGPGGQAPRLRDDTSASTAIERTRALLDAVARTSAATEVTLAWLTDVARTSAATEVTLAWRPGFASTSATTEVTRFSATSGHDLRPDLHAVHAADVQAAAVSGSVSWMSRKYR
jgi:hypothetical protein